MKNSEIPNMTVTDETTIGDLEKNDRGNYAQNVEKKSRVYTFGNLGMAQRFMADAFGSIVKRCGIEIRRNHKAKDIDRMIKKQGVKVEHRAYPPEEPLYRSGLFVYVRGELMGFVSDPFVRKSTLYLSRPVFYIQTTQLEMN